MPDIVDAATRSRMMSGIRSKDTKPELVIRKGLHARGIRYRLHSAKVPGRPDLVLARYRAAVFVHGCFWHGHDCHLFRWPSSRQEFWQTKINRNREVDARSARLLEEAGWRQGVVWECALKGRERLPLEEVIGTCAGWLRSDLPYLEVRGRQK